MPRLSHSWLQVLRWGPGLHARSAYTEGRTTDRVMEDWLRQLRLLLLAGRSAGAV